MASIRPFAALLPPVDLATHISCPPYDVVTAAEAGQYIKNNRSSFMRVIRAEAELGAETQPYAREVYDRAQENFALFQCEGWLQQQSVPHFFIYRLRDGDHAQTGVVACCSVDEYESGVICRHENTKPDKENDRMQHILALSAHPEPVLLVHRRDNVIAASVEDICQNQPLYDFSAEDGVQHQLWPVPELNVQDFGDSRLRGSDIARLLIEAFAQVPRLYIADGHHRSASASRARAELHARNAHHTGNEEYNFFPAVLFPAEQLRILAYNRVLRHLPHWQPGDFLRRLQREFDFNENTSGMPRQKGECSIYLAGRWHSFALRSEHSHDPAAQLDLSRLQKQLLEPFWNIADQRTDARLDFIGGKNSASTLQRLVDSGEAQIGLSLFPPTLEELFAVSDRGELMPPKSTWFEPKLRSGLFAHVF